MIEKNAKIYVAGHRGMVVQLLLENLKDWDIIISLHERIRSKI